MLPPIAAINKSDSGSSRDCDSAISANAATSAAAAMKRSSPRTLPRDASSSVPQTTMMPR